MDCVLSLARVVVVDPDPGRLVARDSRMAEMPQLQSSWLADDRAWACFASSKGSVERTTESESVNFKGNLKSRP